MRHYLLGVGVGLVGMLALAGPGCKNNARYCNSAQDCPSKQCDTAKNECVPVGQPTDCKPPTPYLVDGKCRSCGDQGGGNFCKAQNPNKPLCLDNGACSGCAGDSDCKDPTLPYCDPDLHACGPCTKNDVCAGATACDLIPHSTTFGQCIMADYFVKADAPSTGADGSRDHPFKTIGKASDTIRSAQKSPVVVRVMAGEYQEAVAFFNNYSSNAITVTLFGDGADKTIIDNPRHDDPGGLLTLANSNTVIVYGLTVSGSGASDVYCGGGQTFKAYQSRFTRANNYGIAADANGGSGCTLFVDGITVDHNGGGGILAKYDFHIENSVIYRNDSSGTGGFSGGGVTLGPTNGAANFYFVNNTVADNRINNDSSAGVLCNTHVADIYLGNTILFFNNNSKNKQNETNCMTAYAATDDSAFAKPNDIVIATDPTTLFANDGTDDFHILSTSKAIKAGMVNPTSSLTAPDHDRDMNSRPTSGMVDIGAYQYQAPK